MFNISQNEKIKGQFLLPSNPSTRPIKLTGARSLFCSFTKCFAGARRETERGVYYGKNIYKRNPYINEETQKNQKSRILLPFYIRTLSKNENIQN